MKLDFDLKKIDLRAFFNSRRYLVYAMLMVVIGVGIILVEVVPQMSGLIDLVSANNQEQSTVKALQTKVTSLQQVNYLSEFSMSKQVDLALPSEKPLLQLLTGVNTVAQQAGVTLSDIETSPGKLASSSATAQPLVTGSTAIDDSSTEIPGVNILTIVLKAHGSLDQINNFLDAVEKITPITQATQLKLILDPTIISGGTIATASGTVGSPDRFEADLHLSTYYFAQPISVAVDAQLPTIGPKEETFLKSLNSYQFPNYQQQQQIQGGGSSDLFGAQ